MGPTTFALTIRASRQMLNLYERGLKGTRLETLYRIEERLVQLGVASRPDANSAVRYSAMMAGRKK